MTENHTLEQRVATLEAEVAALKREHQNKSCSDPDWLQRVSGSLNDFPEFQEVVEFGKLERQKISENEC